MHRLFSIARLVVYSVVVTGLGIAGWSCAEQGARELVYSDAKGSPLDWAGMAMKCRDSECGGMLTWQRDYDYECDRCGAKTTARRRGMQVEFGGRY